MKSWMIDLLIKIFLGLITDDVIQDLKDKICELVDKFWQEIVDWLEEKAKDPANSLTQAHVDDAKKRLG